ncbi:peroxin 20 [Fusarium austroafricanum]|uniref:Peroxin 20 n=1 Tax=Fusarium austroafricanum TaxID=2364996 RepID=A0A8H4NPR5_9HYPO|nr:peroxin 20 [Fusarium austroafricanum]
MADASCSGGTPFKRLIDHQARDVSHHQDRLVDRAGPQGHASFRSTPQQMQGGDGFGAFIDGPATLAGIHQHHAAGRLAAHAAVFEQGHSSAFHAAQASQFRQGRPSPTVDISNWAADFDRFTNQSQQRQPLQNGLSQAAPQMYQPAPQMNFQAAFVQPNAAFSPMYGQTNGTFMNGSAATQEAGFDDEMSKWMANNAGGGMEAVDAMMDQMARELELNDAAVAKAEAEEASQEETVAEPTLEPNPTNLATPDIASLSLETEEPVVSEPVVEAPKTKSEVADAAERLLESVEHEDGEKWKNSVFLSLMRDFRDGRKDIIDNEIRETPENVANISQDAQ